MELVTARRLTHMPNITKPQAYNHKVIGYLRVSTGVQDLENQRLGILEMANKNHWQVEFVERTERDGDKLVNFAPFFFIIL
jgi:hypothetical protein